MFVYLAYGLGRVVFSGVVTQEMAKEIWNGYGGTTNSENFIWIMREATKEDIETYNKKKIV